MLWYLGSLRLNLGSTTNLSAVSDRATILPTSKLWVVGPFENRFQMLRIAALILAIIAGLTGATQASVFKLEIRYLSRAELRKLEPIQVFGGYSVERSAPDNAIIVHVSDFTDYIEPIVPPTASIKAPATLELQNASRSWECFTLLEFVGKGYLPRRNDFGAIPLAIQPSSERHSGDADCDSRINNSGTSSSNIDHFKSGNNEIAFNGPVYPHISDAKFRAVGSDVLPVSDLSLPSSGNQPLGRGMISAYQKSDLQQPKAGKDASKDGQNLSVIGHSLAAEDINGLRLALVFCLLFGLPLSWLIMFNGDDGTEDKNNERQERGK